jgi:hypothetical protein
MVDSFPFTFLCDDINTIFIRTSASLDCAPLGIMHDSFHTKLIVLGSIHQNYELRSKIVYL